MIDNLINYLKNKKILILGFGREGQSTYKLIRKYLKKQPLFIADEKKDFQEAYDFLQEDNYINFISGEKYLDNLEDYDIIMKTPGISFVGIDTTNFLHKIKSQMELFLEFFDFFTIWITGTKGKSTTSSLIYKILRDQNVKSLLLGNIGVPVFDYIDDIEKDMIIVLEMSSHQLEYMKCSPNIAILLNVYEEHLDHYESFSKYVEAKCNIYKYQTESDYILYNSDNEILDSMIKNTKSKIYKVSLKGQDGSNVYLNNDKVFCDDKIIYDRNEKRNLVGEHNLNNIMFALAVAEILKLDISMASTSVNEFKTLEHRLELVGNYNGVIYYDNSIATVPIATIEAVEALKDVDTLIIGGMDRGIYYTDFIKYLNDSSIRNIICMPKTGHDIARKLNNGKKYVVETLEEAVDVAKKVTMKGKICLLSPAAASYGYFKNFEEKGNMYKEFVKSSF